MDEFNQMQYAAEIKRMRDGARIKEMKCPNCGGTLIYNAAKKALICEFCAQVLDLEEWNDHKISGFDFQDIESHVMQENAENIPIYNCVSCGAEVLAAKEEVSLTCPYCKNNIVLTDKVSSKLRPHQIIPFKISQKMLPDALNAFYKDKVLLPRGFFSEKKLSKVTGVYVPFWIFNGDIEGELAYTGENDNVRREGDYRITETHKYRVIKDARVSFKNLPLDASEKFDDALMDSVGPFDLSEAVDFNMAYLAGYAADRFDVASESLSDRAEKRMKNTAVKVISKKVGGYSRSIYSGSSLKANMTDVKYVLFPVYSFSIDYQGRKLQYAMNGQTGKVVGGVPTGKSRSREYMMVRALAVFAVIMLIFFVLYMMGV